MARQRSKTVQFDANINITLEMDERDWETLVKETMEAEDLLESQRKEAEERALEELREDLGSLEISSSAYGQAWVCDAETPTILH